MILYPFVEGHNGYEVDLSANQWREFGAALKRIHTAEIPAAITRKIRQESYSPKWRETVRRFLEHVEGDVLEDPVALEVDAFLKTKRDEILDLINRTERLVQTLQAQSLERIVCHYDLHAGNLLLTSSGDFYIVDWDNPILAPKERDLMFIGGGQFANRRTPQEEESLFYQGYGQTPINQAALAYYRYERIIEDIAVICEQLLLTGEGGDDREQSLHNLKSNFLPNRTIEIAYKADKKGV